MEIVLRCQMERLRNTLLMCLQLLTLNSTNHSAITLFQPLISHPELMNFSYQVFNISIQQGRSWKSGYLALIRPEYFWIPFPLHMEMVKCWTWSWYKMEGKNDVNPLNGKLHSYATAGSERTRMRYRCYIDFPDVSS